MNLTTSNVETLSDHESPLFRLAEAFCEPTKDRDPFINRGLSLHSLVLFESHARFGLVKHLEFARVKLRAALEELESRPLSTSLYRGVTGLGWLVRSYYSEIDEDWTGTLIDDLNAHLVDGLSSTKNPGIDVVDGIAGITLYSISGVSVDAPRGQELLDVLHSSLLGCVGGYVLKDSSRLSDAYRNLGLAHGVPGLLLSAVLVTEKLGRAPDPVLIDAFEKLWSHALIEGESASFPHVEGQSGAARLAWCYGNLGLWSVFNAVSRVDPRFKSYCDQIMRAIVTQFESGNGALVDSCICHGHAGIVAFASFARRQGVSGELRAQLDAALAESAKTTMNSISDWKIGPPTTAHVQADKQTSLTNFLEGSAGCALALSAIKDNKAPRWEKLLGYV